MIIRLLPSEDERAPNWSGVVVVSGFTVHGSFNGVRSIRACITLKVIDVQLDVGTIIIQEFTFI
jgi:hypothetical protein